MARRSQGRQNTNKRQTTYRKQAYIHGSAVPKVAEILKEPPKKKLSHATRKNRDKAKHMNLGYVGFLVLALVVTGYVLIGYIQLQSDITSSMMKIARLESQWNEMRIDNEEEYNRINSNIDLEEIKRIAIEELGMSYANEGQVFHFSSQDNDYVRQYSDLPKE